MSEVAGPASRPSPAPPEPAGAAPSATAPPGGSTRAPAAAPPRWLQPGPLALAALVLTVGVTLTATPGVFTIDEDNQLATLLGLGEPGYALPGTRGLPPSPELLWFDPVPRHRPNPATITSTAPPLWAYVAWPFARAGWLGLVALQALAFALAAWLVARTAAAHARSPHTPAVALAAFVGGGFLWEYAQGIWPHALSVLLVLSGALLVAAVAEARHWPRALAAGLFLGLATGLRYQNLVPALALGLALVAGARRVAPTLGFGAGLGLPLLGAALINQARLGVLDPVTKGPAYRALGGADGGSRVADALASTWARVAYYPAWPDVRGSAHGLEQILTRDASTGALLVEGVVKKALLQSAPWAAVALVFLLGWPWLARRPAAERRLALAALAVVASLLGVFALYGFSRHDALCYNQRYLLELLPFLALGVAFACDGHPLSTRLLALAAIGGAGAFGALLHLLPPGPSHRQLTLLAPLVLATGTLLAWGLARRGVRRAAPALGVGLGLTLGWAAAVHHVEDVPASHRRRARNAETAALVRAALDERPAAVFVYWGLKDGLGPLLLDHDLVVADTWIDQGASAPALASAFLAQGRRVLVVPAGPAEVTAPLLAAFPARLVGSIDRPLLELGPR